MINITLTDDVETLQLKALQIPFVEKTLEKSTDVETLSGDVHTHFITTKRLHQYQLE